MSVEVDYFYGDQLFQATPTLGWYWPLGEPADGRYWSLAVVPELANVDLCQLLRFWWSTDNSHQMHLTAFFDVLTDAGGSIFGIKAIRAPAV